MADTIKSASELKLVWNFFDSDDRTETLPNPKDDLAPSDVKTFAAWCAANNPIIGDKKGAAVVGIKDATVVEKTKLDLDLTLI